MFAIARRRAIDHLRRPHHGTAPIELVRDLSGSDGREAAETLVWAREVRRSRPSSARSWTWPTSAAGPSWRSRPSWGYHLAR